MFEHYARLTTKHLPDYINWLEEGAVTAVKDHHHHCASAWAHTAAATIEGDFYIRTGIMDALSSQQFIDCDELSLGCHGGQYVNAFEHAIDHPVMLAKDYPWVGEKQECNYNHDMGRVLVNNFINIVPEDPVQLKIAVKMGPVAASISSSSKWFQFYKAGVITSEECGGPEQPLDSSVTIVGYGIDHHTGLEYWLIKNSWGSTWGDKGFGRVGITKNGPGVCNI